MRPATELKTRSERGIALIIVLAFIVLLAGLVVAYLSRTGTGRQVAHGSFNDAKADQLARSAVDIVVADLKQEIVAGSTPSSVNGYTIYTPSTNANMLPITSGTPSDKSIPNLVRRSVRSDPASRASAINSTTDLSLNNRSISPARWNKHYLIPRLNTGITVDSTPVATFVAPDWVLVGPNGPAVIPVPSTTVTGRYAYAIYDEGGLLDANVAGYPSPSPSPTAYVQTIGRKGSAAYANLTAIPTSTASPPTTLSALQVNTMVGWRNYASTQPDGDFLNNFTFAAGAAQNYISFVASNTGFLTVSSAAWNGRTDQAFATRQQLLALRSSLGFSQNALQYLGTFSREINRPTWKPSTPTSINPDLSILRVTTQFTRFDGTSAAVGEPLLKTRFSLRRLSWLTYKGPSSTRTIPPSSPTPATTDPNYDMWQLVYVYGVSPTYLAQGTAQNIKTCFGLAWDSRAYVASPRAGQQWFYTSPSSANSGGNFNGTSGTAATVIKTLSTVQSEAREPDFFEILKAVILNGSVGLGSNSNTFIATDLKYFSAPQNTDYQIMQIGANIMDSWDTDNIPTFISFRFDPTSVPPNQPYVLAGIENLPYLNKLVFCPNFPPQNNGYFDAWLVPSFCLGLWLAAGCRRARAGRAGCGVNGWRRPCSSFSCGRTRRSPSGTARG